MKFLKAFKAVIDEIVTRFIQFGLVFVSVMSVCYLLTKTNLVVRVSIYIWFVLVGFLAIMKGIDKYQKLKIKELEQQIKAEKEKQAKIEKQIENKRLIEKNN